MGASSSKSKEASKLADFDANSTTVGPVSNNAAPGGPLSEKAELAAAEARIDADGFDADGRPGGPYSAAAPPPGKVFGGFQKGATDVTWVDRKSAAADGAGSVLLSVGLDCEQRWPTTGSCRWPCRQAASRKPTSAR